MLPIGKRDFGRAAFLLPWIVPLVLPLVLEGSVPASDGGNLVRVTQGTLPIVISVPHGGEIAVPGGEKKEKGSTLRDLHTIDLAEMTIAFLTKRFGRKPYVVLAQFSRHFVDVNRGPDLSPDEAYSGPISQKYYDAYHDALRKAVDEIRETFGTGLLIDLHGQSAEPDHMIRGTVNGMTVTGLLERHGLEALIGPNSFFGALAANEVPVLPPVNDAPESPAGETIFLDGYIIRKYGSHHTDGIDAIQLEVGRNHRRSNIRRETARKLADAIATYLETYVLNESALTTTAPVR